MHDTETVNPCPSVTLRPPGEMNDALTSRIPAAICLPVALVLISCGGDKSTPTSSTPATTTSTSSSTTTTTTVAPSLATLLFAPETTNPAGNSYTIDAALGVPGEITLRMNAFNFVPGRPVHKVRATLIYDASVLAPADNTFQSGPWMTQGGALTEFNLSSSPGRYVIRIDRPDSVPGVSGSGTIFSKRFVAVAGVRNRSTPLQWTDTDAFTSEFAQALSRAYGGTVTVQ